MAGKVTVDPTAQRRELRIASGTATRIPGIDSTSRTVTTINTRTMTRP